MMKKVIFFLCFFSVLSACDKESETYITYVAPEFYEYPRYVLLSEEFDDGYWENSFSSHNSIDVNINGYVQTGPCEETTPGYLSIGCLHPLGSNPDTITRKYSSTFIKYVRQNEAEFSLSSFYNYTNIWGFEISFETGGYAEFRFGKFSVVSKISPSQLNGKTLHVLVNTYDASFIAHLDGQDVSSELTTKQYTDSRYELLIISDNKLEYVNSTPYLNYYGTRIDKLEIYMPYK